MVMGRSAIILLSLWRRMTLDMTHEARRRVMMSAGDADFAADILAFIIYADDDGLPQWHGRDKGRRMPDEATFRAAIGGAAISPLLRFSRRISLPKLNGRRRNRHAREPPIA